MSKIAMRLGKLKKIKPGKNEGGYALLMVLVLLIGGGITLVPLMLLMTAGLTSSHHHEERMLGFYSADAGIEDAAYKILYDDPGLPQGASDSWEYTIEDPVNGYQIDVTIENLWILAGLETDAYGTMPHAELVVVGSIREAGTYQIEVSYDGSVGELKINRIGAWLPAGFSYVSGSSEGITAHHKIPDDPTPMPFRGGTALIWDFDGNVKFEDMPPPGGGEPGSAEFPIKRVLTFHFTPSMEPKGVFSWIRTNRHDIYLSWDVASGTYKVTATAGETTIESYIARAKPHERISEVYGDYRAIGQSLMINQYEDDDWDYWGNYRPKRDTLLFGSDAEQASVTDIPDDSTVVMAYLYWSAWRRYPTDITGYDEDELFELAQEIDEAKFKRPGETAQWETADRIQILPNGSLSWPNGWSYSCRADVTSLITGNGNGDYKVKEIEGITTTDTGNEWSYAGWSLLIVYSSAEEQAHQLYLYDDFLYADNDTQHIFPIEGFLAPSDSDGRLTCFVGEGDECYGDHNYDEDSDAPWGDTDWVKLSDNYLSDPTDEVGDDWDNVWNGKSSGIGGEPIDGVDIDTFDISLYINEDDTEAELKLGTGVDSWNLVYVILSFRTVPGTESGLFPVGIMTYSY